MKTYLIIALRFLDLAAFLLGGSLLVGGVAAVHWPSSLIVAGALVLSTVFVPRLVKGKP